MKVFNIICYIIAAICVCVLGYFLYNGLLKTSVPTIDNQTVTVRTEYKTDTIVVHNPIPYEVRIIDTLYITDSLVLIDTINNTVALPVEQKIYKDSNYTAYISGFYPKLDSISVYNRMETKYITIQNTYKVKRWGLGIQVGYGLYKSGFTPYLGIGLSYNIINF